jgi:IMP dehydrogenase
MIREGLTFDDVLLVPQYSELSSRSLVDLSVKINTFQFKHPIIPANMKTITGKDLAFANSDLGGLSILHRFMPIEEQLEICRDKNIAFHHDRFAVSVGVQSIDRENVSRFVDVGIKIFCIDIAHGDSKLAIEMCQWIRQNYPDVLIIAGNVATGSAAVRLWRAGADVVKVGIGPGSLCTTRVETGNGVPQLTALMDVAKARSDMYYNKISIESKLGEISAETHDALYLNKYKHYIIADGGIKSAGDIVKALCFADMVMAGNIFAGCSETPGETVIMNGVSYKNYVGSSTHKANHIEGVAAMVPAKGRFNDILTKLLEGLSSGCSYQGVQNLLELKDNPTFIRITNAGLKESHPHSVILT